MRNPEAFFHEPELPEEVKTELKSEKKNLDLYSISEVDGSFEVVLPGLFDKKHGAILGTSHQRFETKEEAEEVAEKVKENLREEFERISLGKVTRSCYGIYETPIGKYRVTIPRPIHSEKHDYVGATSKEFEIWQEAKEYFLQQMESEERLVNQPLLEIQTNENEKIAFSDFSSFNPQVTPSEKTHEIPESVKKYLFNKGKNSSNDSTYQNTIREKGWERELYSFVSSYLKEEGAEMAKELRIDHLDAITPKQAIELATQIVVDLTKYDMSQTEEVNRADKGTVLELLKEGQLERSNLNWEGNGVCRNFTSSVKAIFEALKAKQTRFSQLRDTYCLYEGGMSFKPKREDLAKFSMDGGHAWNTFVTISKEGAANATIIDTTWAKRNLETKEIEGLDYTLTRMEPIVYEIGKELKENIPNKEEQLNRILSFYTLKMERLGGTGGWVTPKEEKQFYLTRMLELMDKKGIPKKLPESLVKDIGQEFLDISAANKLDHSELKAIYNFWQMYRDIDFDSILKNYLEKKSIFRNTDIRKLIYTDRSLQERILDNLMTKEGFEEALKKNMSLRVRTRDIYPNIFDDFSPTTNPDDLAELKYLVSENYILRGTFGLRGNQISRENVEKVYKKAREELRAINPEQYDKLHKRMENYSIIRNFFKIKKYLEKANEP